MNPNEIMQIFRDTAYVRMGGRPEEKQTAEYLLVKLLDMGLKGRIESFEVPLADIQEAVLEADGEIIPCKGYMCAGNADLEAPFYYLRSPDKGSLAQCREIGRAHV